MHSMNLQSIVRSKKKEDNLAHSNDMHLCYFWYEAWTMSDIMYM